MQIDLDRLRLRDLVDIEKRTGKPISSLFPADGGFTTDGLVGFVWAVKRRDDPNFTWDDALDIEFSQLDMADGADPSPDAGSTGG